MLISSLKKNIDISFEQNRKLSNITNTVKDNSTTTTKHIGSHSMSQDQYTSISIASSTNIIVNDSLGDNDSININTDSYDNSSKVLEQSSSSSSSNVVASQKRKRAASTQKSKDKENCISFDDSNDDEHDQDNTICSSGSQLSSTVRRTRQKTRRYE
ncbi:unnamed protein product [Adineta steineri]|uniref:Uncharacterized protein n=2 Tax=Adineta steineri TaxID=433720 RepID=A0A820GI87_9BILA|nr:unnamed protein product [Adineta steineri]